MYFSGHLWAYQAKDAIKAVLHNFRRFYPYSPVDMIIDGGGEDMREIAWTYDCCYFQETFHAGKDIPTNLACSNEWLLRLLRTAVRYNTPYVMIMDQDLLVRGKIEKEPVHDLVGIEKMHYLFQGKLKWILEKHPHLVNKGYGCYGGSLIRRQPLIDSIHEYFRSGIDLVTEASCFDKLITAVMMNAGYQFGYDDYFTDAWHPDWKTNGKPIVHAVKLLDNIRMDYDADSVCYV